jgi:hypothetical protein
MEKPSYSPNLAFSDFYLFLAVKEKLERTQVADEGQFFGSMQAILMVNVQEELDRVFEV